MTLCQNWLKLLETEKFRLVCCDMNKPEKTHSLKRALETKITRERIGEEVYKMIKGDFPFKNKFKSFVNTLRLCIKVQILCVLSN